MKGSNLVLLLLLSVGCDKFNQTTLLIEPQQQPDAVILQAAEDDIGRIIEIGKGIAQRFDLKVDTIWPHKESTFIAFMGNTPGGQFRLSAYRAGHKIIVDISCLRAGPGVGKTELFRLFEDEVLREMKQQFGLRLKIIDSY